MDPMGTRLGRLIKYYEIKLASEIIIWMFPKIVVPQNGWLLKWMIWGYHYFRKHPYKSSLASTSTLVPESLDPTRFGEVNEHDTVFCRGCFKSWSRLETRNGRHLAELRVYTFSGFLHVKDPRQFPYNSSSPVYFRPFLRSWSSLAETKRRRIFFMGENVLMTYLTEQRIECFQIWYVVGLTFFWAPHLWLCSNGNSG